MKNSSIIFILLCVALCRDASAQNLPTDITYPSGGSANIDLPMRYDFLINISGTPIISAPTKFNYVRRWTPQVPLTQATLPPFPTYYSMSLSYANGFGQPLQSTVKLQNDLTTIYDNRPLLNKPSYLPYPSNNGNHGFQMNPFADQKAWYDANYASEGDNAYSRTKSVASGNQQSVVTYSPGKSFTGSDRGVTTSIEINTGALPIRQFVYTGLTIPGSPGIYNEGDLLVKKTEGEHDAVTYEYRNRSNQLICKRVEAGNESTSKILATYYIYDDLGRIVFVVPPKAMEEIEAAYATGGSFSTLLPIYTNLCYNYVYNEFGQVIEKRVPDKSGKEYIVYDRKHRSVMSQSPLLRTQGKWAFQIYDSRDRIVFSGILNNTDARQNWQYLLSGSSTPATGSLEDYLMNGCSGAYPNSLTNCEINSYNYYDSYTFDATFPYTRSFVNAYSADYSVGASQVVPVPHDFVPGLLTATRTRVLDNANPDTWINSVLFYDRKGRIIQSHTLNPWNTTNWDISTIQYNFQGDVSTTILYHNAFSGSTKATTKMVVHNNYESGLLGRLVSTTLSMDGKPAITLAIYNYDELGRVKTKKIGNAVEVQNFTYNIRGQLNGINAGYLNNPAHPDATFGMALSYDYGFDKLRYDGSIAGMVWRGAGSAAKQRAYGYEYDKAGRMTGADFHELDNMLLIPGPWNNIMHDYTVSGITYDANGNMETMKQRGTAMIAGVITPVDMDDLEYKYKPTSNTLDRMEDAITMDYGLGDFQNTNAGTPDYDYDADGNLVSDVNKGISIAYNELDLPTDVAALSNGTVKNVYDAGGTLVQKTINPATGPAEVYRYWGPMVYKDNTLQYALHSEGRARWSAADEKFDYDFFIKDHLGNVRTVVNYEGGGIRKYLATHELASSSREAMIFEGTEKRAPKPGGNGDDMAAALLNGGIAEKRIGTSIMLKVMAGDKFKAELSAYYDGTTFSPQTGQANGSSMLSALIGALSGGISEMGGEAGGTQLINNMLGGDEFGTVYNSIKENSTDPMRPRAYLNYVLFDEDMKVVAEQSGAIQVTQECNGNFADLLMQNEIVVANNGYLLAYMSNESELDVSMDNFLITYSRGNLLEEQHYYPHGLVARDGSNTSLANRYLYQGKEMQNEAGMQLYDFHARQYDPQIGRFWGIDPMDQFPSGYTGMGNDPANMIDPTGMLTNGWTSQGSYSGMSQIDYGARTAFDEMGSFLSEIMWTPTVGGGYNMTINYDGHVSTLKSSQGSGNSGGQKGSEKGQSPNGSGSGTNSIVGSGLGNSGIGLSNSVHMLSALGMLSYNLDPSPEPSPEPSPAPEGGNISPRSFKFTKMTSAVMEAGVSGLWFEVTYKMNYGPDMVKRFDFQTIFVQFPSETMNGRKFSPTEAAKITAQSFQHAMVSVSFALHALSDFKFYNLKDRDVQNLVVRYATDNINDFINAGATMSLRQYGYRTITTPAIWGR